MSTSTIQTEILKELGIDSTDSTNLARALAWANKAIDSIQGYLPTAEIFQESEKYLTTVADQATYALPSDFLQIISMRDDTSGGPIKILSREQFDLNHPDPSTEGTDAPVDVTTEFDRTTSGGRHIMRLGPIPDAAYVIYSTMRTWHPALSGAQDPIYTRLATTIQLGGVYYGSLVVYRGQQQINGVAKADFLESVQNIGQLFAMQKPRPRQIPIKMKKNQWNY